MYTVYSVRTKAHKKKVLCSCSSLSPVALPPKHQDRGDTKTTLIQKKAYFQKDCASHSHPSLSFPFFLPFPPSACWATVWPKPLSKFIVFPLLCAFVLYCSTLPLFEASFACFASFATWYPFASVVRLQQRLGL